MLQTMSASSSTQGSKNHEPVKDGVAERTRVARAAEEEVPDSITEGGGLVCRREACAPGRAAERKSDDLARSLASLDVRGHERAVGQVGAREDRIVNDVANLEYAFSVWPFLHRAELTHVGEIEGGEVAGAEEHVQESQGDGIDRVILTVVGEVPLEVRGVGMCSTVGVLAPVAGVHM